MGDALWPSPLGNTMVPKSLPPRESRTLGDPQPGSKSSPSPRDPQPPRSFSPSWMELLSGSCLVQPVPSGHLLVTLQRTRDAGQGKSQARAGGQPQQVQSHGSSITPMANSSSQSEPPARSPPSPDKEVAPTQPQWPHDTAVTHPNGGGHPTHGGVQRPVSKSGHRRVRYPTSHWPPTQLAATWQGWLPQPPPTRPDTSVRGSSPWLLAPGCPLQPSPPGRDKGTQTKPQATESCSRAPRPPQGPTVSPSEVVPSDIPGRALPKLSPGSPWWPLLQAGSQVSPGPTSPLAGQQPSVTEAMAKGTGGSGKDTAEPVLLGRASPTVLPHEAQTERSSSGCNDGDEPPATWFIAFFVGKFGRWGGKETVASPGISAGWAPVMRGHSWRDNGCLWAGG